MSNLDTVVRSTGPAPFGVLIALTRIAAIALLWYGGSAFGQTPPNPPVITEPTYDGKIVNPADVHMETLPFSDPDPGDTHQCTDWEIWTVSPFERVWVTSCIGGIEKVHTHLGDGTFENSHAGRSELFYDTNYELHVRHRDNTNLWSAFSIRSFTTGSQTQIFPLSLDDVSDSPLPVLVAETGDTLVLSGGGAPPSVRLESDSGSLFFRIAGLDGSTNAVTNPGPLPDHAPVRVVAEGSAAGLVLPQCHIVFTDDHGMEATIYLPAMNVPAGDAKYFWVAVNGSSYVGDSAATVPDFSVLAQGATVPWKVFAPGYKVEIVASGFELPVNIAFVPNPGLAPNSPLYYVTELYGQIKVVTRDGTIGTYADSLLNFDPGGNFPGTGEQGLSGIVVDSATGDVFANMLYDASPPSVLHYPKVVRFHSNDGGLTAATQTTILDMVGEIEGQSHFISNLTIGPDHKLYVHVGDGFETALAQDTNYFRGKILRVNLDGSAPTDNPFYHAANGITATDYLFAYGFRNPFGGAWRASDGHHYEVENGPETDRFAKVNGGVNYLWDGTNLSMENYAIYNWSSHAPVNIAFIQPQTFGGSEFDAARMDHAFVTESGPTWASGPQVAGKRIVEFSLSAGGGLLAGPTTFLEYTGTGKASAAGLASGPDGLYFSDLYKDLNYVTPIDRGANILRIKYVGRADFKSNYSIGAAPLPVRFTDLSDVPNPTAWYWTFGDGATSTERNPLHAYAADGIYDVKLAVTGSNGSVIAKKNAFILVGDIPVGVKGEYYDNIDFTGPLLTRIDTTIDFHWSTGSPDPSMGVDNFSVRWNGRLSPQFSQTYRFYVTTDDGVRLWVNNRLLVDRWNDQGPTEYSDTITLSATKRYDVKMEYYERGGGAVATLSWSSPSVPKQIIPKSRWFNTGITTVFSVANRWNMISNPMLAANDSTAILFPTSTLPAYGYSRHSGFLAVQELPPGLGYWLKFSANTPVGVYGDLLDSIVVPVDSGWNIVGTTSFPVPVGSIVQNPPNNILSPFFGFANGYSLDDTLEPGHGYWVKVRETGTLTLSASAGPGASPFAAGKFVEGLSTLTLTDAAGNRQTLYFGAARPTDELPADVAAPPASPAEVFDARFSSSAIVERYSPKDAGAKEFPISLIAAEYPVTIEWDLAGEQTPAMSIVSGDGASILGSSGAQRHGAIVLSDEQAQGIRLRITPSAAVPSAYALEQNYPNPFNPVTQIRYQLPEAANVVLKVYSLVGQEVATLVNRFEEAGYRTVDFNGAQLASGMYVYRLSAERGGKTFTDVKKMLLLK